MIYTVTLNPAIDKTAVITNFTAGVVNRVETLREDAGGKGINVSKCLKALGAESVAVLLLAGDAGKHLAGLLEQEGLRLLCGQAEGQTRTNLKIVAPGLGQNTDINEPGPKASEETLQALLETLCKKIQPDDIVVLAGSLPVGAPADTYRRWTEALQNKGAKVFLDADGPAMAEGIKGKPYLVKPNETELSRLLGRPMETEEQILAGGKALLEMGVTRALISLGGDGAYLLEKGNIYRAKCPRVEVKSTVGAGDSVVAAMAYGLQEKLPLEESFRLAMAMGAASVMQTGTQAPDKVLVSDLTRQVQVLSL